MNQKGFSLVEMNICIAIITVLAAVAFPSYAAVKQNLSLNKEMRLLHGYLQSAKIEAIKSNAYVVFKTIPEGYSIFVDDGANAGKSGDWERQAGEKTLIDRKYQDGISLSKTTFTANRTRFNGRVAMKAGRVILTNTDGSKKQLVISTVGRIRMERL